VYNPSLHENDNGLLLLWGRAPRRNQIQAEHESPFTVGLGDTKYRRLHAATIVAWTQFLQLIRRY
jgi:hypothetical protein